jgi:hypothetical protein
VVSDTGPTDAPIVPTDHFGGFVPAAGEPARLINTTDHVGRSGRGIEPGSMMPTRHPRELIGHIDQCGRFAAAGSPDPCR